MVRRFGLLASSLALPVVGASSGFCVDKPGKSMCWRHSDCRGCGYDSDCEWRLFNGEAGNLCAGKGYSCRGKNTCGDCENEQGCTWVSSIDGPRPKNGRCVGHSIHCDGEGNCKDCEFWSGCHWEVTPEERGDTCVGNSIHCKSQDECGDCEFWSGCEWTPTCKRSDGAISSGTDRCMHKQTDEECECYPECTWGNMHQGGKSNYTQQCVGDNQYCGNHNDCYSCRTQSLCKWSRVPLGEKPHFCDNRWSGFFCDGQVVRQCSYGGNFVGSRDCGEQGCVGQDQNAGCFCDSKSAGQQCRGFDIVTCPTGQKLDTCQGNAGCVISNNGQATCGTANFCQSKGMGTFCDGTYLKGCNSDQESGKQYCGNAGCSMVQDGQAECGTPGFCVGKSAGWHCDGMHMLKQCSGAENVNNSVTALGSQTHCKNQCSQSQSAATCMGESGTGDGTPVMVGAASPRTTTMVFFAMATFAAAMLA